MDLKIALLIILVFGAALPVAAEKSSDHSAISITREADKPITFAKASNKLKKTMRPLDFNSLPMTAGVNLRGHDKSQFVSVGSDYNDLFGMNKSQLKKRFPPSQFHHNTDSTQITWHGTDVSTVLDIIYKDGKVSQVRPISHYGYPRPLKPSTNVDGFISAPKENKHSDKPISDQEIKDFKKQLKQF